MCETTDKIDQRPKDKAVALRIVLRWDHILRRLDNIKQALLPLQQDEPDDRRIRYVG